MKRIKAMVDSAFTKKDAMDMLEIWRLKGLSDSLYEKGRQYIRESFN